MYKDPISYAQTLLFVMLLNDDLKEYSYYAEVAGIEFKISNELYGLSVIYIYIPLKKGVYL